MGEKNYDNFETETASDKHFFALERGDHEDDTTVPRTTLARKHIFFLLC